MYRKHFNQPIQLLFQPMRTPFAIYVPVCWSLPSCWVAVSGRPSLCRSLPDPACSCPASARAPCRRRPSRRIRPLAPVWSCVGWASCCIPCNGSSSYAAALPPRLAQSGTLASGSEYNGRRQRWRTSRRSGCTVAPDRCPRIRTTESECCQPCAFSDRDRLAPCPTLLAVSWQSYVCLGQICVLTFVMLSTQCAQHLWTLVVVAVACAPCDSCRLVTLYCSRQMWRVYVCPLILRYTARKMYRARWTLNGDVYKLMRCLNKLRIVYARLLEWW